MIIFARILSGACGIYSLLVFLFVTRNFMAFVSTGYSGGYHGRAPFAVSVITFLILDILSVSLPAALSYLLAVTRHRKAALILAVIICVGFPIGTILGVLALFALTRPEVMSEFIHPSNKSLEPSAGPSVESL
jgi:hypothetical protein